MPSVALVYEPLSVPVPILKGMPLTLELAQTLVSAAQAHARDRDLHIAVAVVDEGGLLQALIRMDAAPPLSSQIAEAKAAGAAVWHRDGEALVGVQQERGAFFEAVSRMTRLPIIPAAGSVVIRRDGSVLGAVGVSGATSAEDLQCAEAGLAALGG